MLALSSQVALLQMGGHALLHGGALLSVGGVLRGVHVHGDAHLHSLPAIRPPIHVHHLLLLLSLLLNHLLLPESVHIVAGYCRNRDESA